MSVGPSLIVVLESAAPAVSLAATLPLGPPSVGLRTIRAGLAVTIMSVLAGQRAPTGDVLTVVATGALCGAALGLGATIVARAATAAGALIENTLAPTPLGMGPATAGTVRLLWECGFSWAFLAGGALGAIVGHAVHVLDAQRGLSWAGVRGVAHLGAYFVTTSVALAAPACLAQVLAALMGGAIARAAPQVNGLVLNAPLIALAALGALIFSAPALAGALTQIARAAALLSVGTIGR